MYGRRGFALSVAVFALATSAACSGATSESDSQSPRSTPTTFASWPVEGEVPRQQAQIAGSGPAKLSYPTLTERTQVMTYLRESVRINMTALKSRQPFEVEPVVVRVKGSAACYEVPGAKKRVIAHKIGDKAPQGSPLIAPCVKDGKLVLMVARDNFYTFHLDNNVPAVRAEVIRATQQYLALLAQNRAGGREGYYAECAGGRLFGGLRDRGYISTQWANIQEVDGEVDTEAERIVVQAREQGSCPLEAFGSY